MTIAKLPLAKDIDAFDFTGTPINEGLVRDLATGGFVAGQQPRRHAGLDTPVVDHDRGRHRLSRPHAADL